MNIHIQRGRRVFKEICDTSNVSPHPLSSPFRPFTSQHTSTHMQMSIPLLAYFTAIHTHIHVSAHVAHTHVTQVHMRTPQSP